MPGGCRGALCGRDGRGWYRSVVRLGEWRLGGRIHRLASGWSGTGNGRAGEMGNVQLLLLLTFRCRGWVGVGEGRGWGGASVLGVEGRGLSGCCRWGGLGWMLRRHLVGGRWFLLPFFGCDWDDLECFSVIKCVVLKSQDNSLLRIASASVSSRDVPVDHSRCMMLP